MQWAFTGHMKNLLLMVCVLAGFTAMAAADPWVELQEAQKLQRTQTVIDLAAKIEADALAGERWIEAARAVVTGILAEAEREGGVEVAIKLLDERVGEVPEEVLPLLRTLQARWLFSYYLQNSWRFAERSALDAAQGDDFTTWDLQTILAEIDLRLQAALVSAELLKERPISDFSEIIEEGELDEEFRPTAYDFLARMVLEFYELEEMAAALPQEPFRFGVNSPALGTVDEFLAWEPEVPEQLSWKLKALKQHQQVLQFHKGREDRGPFMYADLQRLEWAVNAVSGSDDEASKKWIAAMEAWIEAADPHVVASAGRAALAEHLIERVQWEKAHAVATAGAKAHPKHVFGQACERLIAVVEARSLNLEIEDAWTPAGAEISVTARNVERVYFRAYSHGWNAAAEFRAGNVPRERKELGQWLGKETYEAWDFEITPGEPYAQTQETFVPSVELKPGFYVVIASASPDFEQENNAIVVTGVHVTKLAMSLGNETDGVRGVVVDAVTGAPLQGVRVDVSGDPEQRNRREETVKTDVDGMFQLRKSHQGSLMVVARDGEHRIAQQIWAGELHQPQTPERVEVLFTDRAIYRPGQQIHFKGVLLHRGDHAGDERVAADEAVEVVLKDPNGRDVEALKLTTNSRGGFSGTFTAPSGAVLGHHSISATPHGGASVRVEEYKRPTFLVKMEAPVDQVKLNGPVTVVGLAEGYTGAAVDGAKVSWRVTRVPRWPDWIRFCWWFTPNPESEEIAHGVAITGVDGKFPIEFDAVPDPDIDPATEPVFDFRITADVTDGAGETRSVTRVVSVAYTSLRAEIHAPDWIEAGGESRFELMTFSHDSEPRAGKGTLKWHRLVEPATVPRSKLTSHWGLGEVAANPADPNSWELGEVVYEAAIDTGEDGKSEIVVDLAPGIYRMVFSGIDEGGREIQALRGIQVVDLSSERFPSMIPSFTGSPSWQAQPGEAVQLVWGTGEKEGHALVMWMHRGKVVHREWSKAGRTQETFTFEIEEKHRGGLDVMVLQIAQNRQHWQHHSFIVPWTNRQLSVEWETIRSKLEPGAHETWTARIRRADGEPVDAEMVATLYDASLEAFVPHEFPQLEQYFLRHYPGVGWTFASQAARLNQLSHFKSFSAAELASSFARFRSDFEPYHYYYGLEMAGGGGARFGAVMAMSAPMSGNLERRRPERGLIAAPTADIAMESAANLSDPEAPMEGSGVALDAVPLRTNLQETAFFFPHLETEEDGTIRISFEMPEALTQWKFLGFAHDAELRHGYLTGETVTAKDLMVLPNPPRFVREGDVIEFSARVLNQSDIVQSGTVRLQLLDATNRENIGGSFELDGGEQEFEIAAKESRSVKWRIRVPNAAGVVIYQVSATAGTVRDGEEGWLPVIPRRIVVTESLALPIRDAGEKEFDFAKLRESRGSDSLDSLFLEVQVVSQPAWYAVMALPYLMEGTFDSADVVFHRYYATSLARHIANSDPKIRDIFAQWRGTDALESPLTKNEDIKSILLEETPWLREADAESSARRKVGLLFDGNHMDNELARHLTKLREMQLGNGLWPWFEGGPSSEFISLEIVRGFGRLRNLGVSTDITSALQALPALDRTLTERYQYLVDQDLLDRPNFSPWIAHHLYTRSFFLKDRAHEPADRQAWEYFVGKAREHWMLENSRFAFAQTALALNRLGHAKDAKLITRALRENSVTNDELGMYWKDPAGWNWWQAPIEAQVMAIEAFSEVDNDAEAVGLCQVWLIKQKQTQDWTTRRATADAVYALLMGGENLLGSDALLEVELGGARVEPGEVEAGTGFYEHRFDGAQVIPEMADITLRKSDKGVSWASVHWQYLEDISKITAHTETPLTLEKKLFIRRATPAGPVLVELENERPQVGDEVVTRVIVRTDRAMDYVHLKDYRGSGTEPVNVLSGYRAQDLIGYYEVTRDTATHFFIEHLPVGTHVFESSVRIQHEGVYPAGIAELRCLYAPEFNSHSASVMLRVGE